jgi:hypothetical protein
VGAVIVPAVSKVKVRGIVRGVLVPMAAEEGFLAMDKCLCYQ